MALAWAGSTCICWPPPGSASADSIRSTEGWARPQGAFTSGCSNVDGESLMATAQTQSADSAALKQSSTGRLVSLDAFRGAIIALMVLVNDPGDGRHVYGPLNHAEWHGWTITREGFPSFLWIVGSAMTFSIAQRLAAGNSPADAMLPVLLRAA